VNCVVQRFLYFRGTVTLTVDVVAFPAASVHLTVTV
jgi:hypothetical protein